MNRVYLRVLTPALRYQAEQVAGSSLLLLAKVASRLSGQTVLLYPAKRFQRTFRRLLSSTPLPLPMASLPEWLFVEAVWRRPPFGEEFEALLNSFELVEGGASASVKLTTSDSGPVATSRLIPLLKGTGEDASKETVFYAVRYGLSALHELVLDTPFKGEGFTSEMLEVLRHAPKSKAQYILVLKVEGEGSMSVIGYYSTENVLIVPQNYPAGSQMNVYYMGAVDSEVVLEVRTESYETPSSTYEMTHLGNGIFRATVNTPTSGLLVLRAEDRKYKISAVRMLEPAKDVAEEITDRIADTLHVDAVYDDYTYQLRVVVWREKEGWLLPFEPEDSVFIEIRTASEVLSLANASGDGSEFVQYTETIYLDQPVIITASFDGKKAVKVLSLKGTGTDSGGSDVIVLT